MSKKPQNHHYVPQGYLRGFGFHRMMGLNADKKKSYAIVHDFDAKTSQERNLVTVCALPDFMRFEKDGHSPYELEHELGKFEGAGVKALRRIVERGQFDGDDKIQVLNLMAFLGVRSPERRDRMKDFIARSTKKFMDVALQNKERWEQEMVRLSEKTGKTYTKTYEEIKEFHDSDRYKITVPRERLIGMELGVFETVLDSLSKRKWTLYTTDGQHGTFVTTNCPVVLSFIDPDKVPAWAGPGYELKNTEVFFPLTKHAFLIGRWDKGGHTEVARRDFIGVVNRHMIEHADGLVISEKRTVLYYDPLMRLHWDDKLVERVTTPPTEEELAEYRARYGDDQSQQ